MTINERITAIRKEKSMTMAEFGSKIGIGRSSISLLESGRNNPSEQTIRSICREFGVNEEWLLNGTGHMYDNVEKSARLMEWATDIMKEKDDSIKKKVVNLLMSLNESDWDLIAELAKRIKDRTE